LSESNSDSDIEGSRFSPKTKAVDASPETLVLDFLSDSVECGLEAGLSLLAGLTIGAVVSDVAGGGGGVGTLGGGISLVLLSRLNGLSLCCVLSLRGVDDLSLLEEVPSFSKCHFAILREYSW
jgi:hypothetical protein